MVNAKNVNVKNLLIKIGRGCLSGKSVPYSNKNSAQKQTSQRTRCFFWPSESHCSTVCSGRRGAASDLMDPPPSVYVTSPTCLPSPVQVVVQHPGKKRDFLASFLFIWFWEWSDSLKDRIFLSIIILSVRLTGRLPDWSTLWRVSLNFYQSSDWVMICSALNRLHGSLAHLWTHRVIRCLSWFHS